MLRAGYSGKNSVRMFHAIQFLLAILFLIGGLIIALVKSFSQEMTMTSLLLHSLLPCAIGYYIPRYWVNKRVNQRQTEIIQGFPDALDLMLVCVEAGQSLDQSIIRVGKESRAGYPALADEFDMVAQEVKAGKERISVLKDMAERVGVPDVASFVTTRAVRTPCSTVQGHTPHRAKGCSSGAPSPSTTPPSPRQLRSAPRHDDHY